MNGDSRDTQLVARILRSYNLPVVTVHSPQKGYRNAAYPATLAKGQMVNCIIYKDEPGILARIRHAHQLGEYLHVHGFAVRYPLDARISCLRSPGRARYAAVYPYLPGTTIPWEAYTHQHLKLLGKTMSDMHATLADLPTPNLPHVADEYLAIVSRMSRYFGDPQVQMALHHKLGLVCESAIFTDFTTLLQVCRQLARAQPLHMDFVRGNILFDSPRGALQITGILDFEKAALGHPLFDIARTLAFLLVDCKYKTEAQVRKSFLQSGYARRGQARLVRTNVVLRSRQVDILQSLTDLFLLYDWYKFLRHNPYESLLANQHFVRTRDLLLRAGLLAWQPRRSSGIITK